MRELTRRRRRVAAMAVTLALVAAGCGGEEEKKAAPQAKAKQFPAGTTMGRLQREGEITIGVKFDVPPFGFKNPQSDQVEGFDPDIGRAVAEELGVEPKFIEAVTDNRIPFLKRGTTDLILSTLTINKERDGEIDFSTPYYVARGQILVPKGSTIDGIDGVAGKRVCTTLGSTFEEIIRKQAPRADLNLVDTFSECLELVQNRAVDAIAVDDVIGTGMIIQDRSLGFVGDQISTEPYGAGIKEGDRELKRFVDGVVERYKSDGRWAAAYQKWLGQYTKQQQDPPKLTLREALEVNQ